MFLHLQKRGDFLFCFLTEIIPVVNENFSSWFSRLGFWFENLFGNIFGRLRAGLTALNDFSQAYDDMFNSLFYLNGSGSVSPDGTKYLILEPFVANFRFFVGDLIFSEIYALLMVAAGFYLFKLVFKIVEALRSIPAFNTGSKGNLFNKFFG